MRKIDFQQKTKRERDWFQTGFKIAVSSGLETWFMFYGCK